MTYHLFILGCQQNYYDAERIAHFLDEMGYVRSEEKNADLIIIFACSVRQSAVDQIYGKLRQWKNIENNKTVILTACVLPADRKKLENKIDAIIKVSRIEKDLPKYLSFERSEAKSRTINQSFSTEAIRRSSDLSSRRIKNKQAHAFISIMSGCNNFCSYCAVPYTRGREISRPMKEIVCEAKALVEHGMQEITLLGQNVNSYVFNVILSDLPAMLRKARRAGAKNPFCGTQDASFASLPQHDNKSDFVKLLEQLEKIDGLEKISFLTSHPKDISRSLIEWMGKSKKFSGELHLPVQSGDDEILKKMNRHYTVAQYLHLVKQIRKSCPKIKLSTDIIVGFPSETREQFENTIKLCRKIGFKKAYVSQYSPRPNTVAAKLKDDAPKSEKKRRWQILDDLMNNHNPEV